MICMNNYAQFYIMISCSRDIRKYHTGEEIKSIVSKCIKDNALDRVRRRQIEKFNSKYIQCKQPIMDDQLYYLRWVGESNFDELKCFRKLENIAI